MMSGTLANSADPDQTPHYAAPDHDIHCFASAKIKFSFLRDLPVSYSEEKAMMAGILSVDQLKKRREKVRNMVFSY